MDISGVFERRPAASDPTGSITNQATRPQTNRRRIAWSYRHRPSIEPDCASDRRSSAEITKIAWKAQNRLLQGYMKLMAAGKDQRKVMTALGAN